MKVDNTLYLKPDGTWVSAVPSPANCVVVTNSTNNIVHLSVIFTTDALSLTKTGANSYSLNVNATTRLSDVEALLDTILTSTVTGTTSTLMTGNVTAQTATFMKNSYTDCLLDFPITIGSPAKTLSFKIVGTNFNLFNINGVYIWINTQNRLPNLR